ncbi:MAG: aminoacyl-tRNA hydrolase [Lachnospiraceae bacterium]|nr:aminoacyl-tRNA hydrolase [Lachnospiraceae bacterium]
MYIIVGLGNPGREYVNTRHNIGFQVLEKLAEQEGISVLEKKHKAVIGRGIVAGQKCILARPLTFMNLSGESVREMVDYYKADETSELIIVSDDISLDVGQIRIRKKGSAGGHNGLKSIIAHLGHDSFIRIKMGVGGKPEGWDLADYVLGHVSLKEREVLDEAAGQAADAIRMILTQGADAAMNRYNTVKHKNTEKTTAKPNPEAGTGEKTAARPNPEAGTGEKTAAKPNPEAGTKEKNTAEKIFAECPGDRDAGKG